MSKQPAAEPTDSDVVVLVPEPYHLALPLPNSRLLLTDGQILTFRYEEEDLEPEPFVPYDPESYRITSL